VNLEKKICRLLEKGAVCVGITSLTGPQIAHGIQCAKLIKKKSNIPIVWGGVHPTMLPEQTLRSKYVDIVVLGEGEIVFAELVKRLAKGKDYKNLKGIGYKNAGEIFVNARANFIKDLDSTSIDLPYHLIEIEKYIYCSPLLGSKRTFEISTSRGCVHDCGFCYNKFFNNCTWRSNTPENIIQRTTRAKEDFAIDGITWREDNFFANKDRVERICKQLISNKINIKWQANCRLDYFVAHESSFLKLLKDSGCRCLGIGIESGSTAMLKKMKKKIRVADIGRANEKAKKHNLKILWHFMAGFPNEKRKDVEMTLNIIHNLLRDPENSLHGPHFYTPYPNTDLFEESVRAGFKPPTKLAEWAALSWLKPHFTISKKCFEMIKSVYNFAVILRNKTAIHLYEN